MLRKSWDNLKYQEIQQRFVITNGRNVGMKGLNCMSQVGEVFPNTVGRLYTDMNHSLHLEVMKDRQSHWIQVDPGFFLTMRATYLDAETIVKRWATKGISARVDKKRKIYVKNSASGTSGDTEITFAFFHGYNAQTSPILQNVLLQIGPKKPRPVKGTQTLHMVKDFQCNLTIPEISLPFALSEIRNQLGGDSDGNVYVVMKLSDNGNTCRMSSTGQIAFDSMEKAKCQSLSHTSTQSPYPSGDESQSSPHSSPIFSPPQSSPMMISEDRPPSCPISRHESLEYPQEVSRMVSDPLHHSLRDLNYHYYPPRQVLASSEPSRGRPHLRGAGPNLHNAEQAAEHTSDSDG